MAKKQRINKKATRELIDQIKDEERKIREAKLTLEVLVEQTAEEPLAPNAIDFDEWWAMMHRGLKLQPHMKEIIAADFKARGAQSKETKAKFDELLDLFGIKI